MNKHEKMWGYISRDVNVTDVTAATKKSITLPRQSGFSGGRKKEEYPKSRLIRVSEWCNLWVMKLNESTTKTMIVSRSGTMHPQSPPLTIGGTVMKESDDLVILGAIFDSKLAFEKHLRLDSRAASQRLGILRKSFRVFHDRSLLKRSGFCPASFGVLFYSVVLGCRYTP